MQFKKKSSPRAAAGGEWADIRPKTNVFSQSRALHGEQSQAALVLQRFARARRRRAGTRELLAASNARAARVASESWEARRTPR